MHAIEAAVHPGTHAIHHPTGSAHAASHSSRRAVHAIGTVHPIILHLVVDLRFVAPVRPARQAVQNAFPAVPLARAECAAEGALTKALRTPRRLRRLWRVAQRAIHGHVPNAAAHVALEWQLGVVRVEVASEGEAHAVRVVHAPAETLDGACPQRCLARGGDEARIVEQLEQLPLEAANGLERAHAEEVLAAEGELGIAREAVPLVVRAQHGQVVRHAAREAHLCLIRLLAARERREKRRARRERRRNREHVVGPVEDGTEQDELSNVHVDGEAREVQTERRELLALGAVGYRRARERLESDQIGDGALHGGGRGRLDQRGADGGGRLVVVEGLDGKDEPVERHALHLGRLV